MQHDPAAYSIAIWQGKRIEMTHKGCDSYACAFQEVPTSTVALDELITEAQRHHERTHQAIDHKDQLQRMLDAYDISNVNDDASINLAISHSDGRAWLAANRGHPSICLCPACAPHEAEYDRMQAEEAARLRVAEIQSPDYCDHYKTSFGWCNTQGCRHEACRRAQEDPPF